MMRATLSNTSIMDITQEQVDIFWSKVGVGERSECWEWLGAKKPKGYGNVRVNSKYMLAHRLAWELSSFKIPDGYLVMHSCDNPPCCNPSHLMLGRPMANFKDMVSKGRQEFKKNKAVGMRNVNAVLTREQVAEVRSRYAAGGVRQVDLADEFGVTQSAISSIVRFATRKEA
jgi:hypothetical protein